MGISIIVLWLMFPKSLLLSFLIIASYHFGKEDSEFIADKRNLDLAYFFKGSIAITAPLLFHKNETLNIFNTLNFNVSQSFFVLNEFLYVLILIDFAF